MERNEASCSDLFTMDDPSWLRLHVRVYGKRQSEKLMILKSSADSDHVDSIGFGVSVATGRIDQDLHSFSVFWQPLPGEEVAMPHLKRQVTDTFTTLNEVDGKRKKNMVWIQKIPGRKITKRI